jgi:TolB protein
VPTATTLPSVLEARGSMAYVVRENGQDDIWAVNIGTRTPIRIVASPADDRDPAWSPDGTKLAYASRQDGYWDLYVYNLLTNSTARITVDLSFQGSPKWSPDGQWLVYENYQGNNLDIYVVPVDGSQPPQRITENAAPDFSPAWSPDGRRIAFVSWRDGNQDIYIFSLDNPSDSASINLTNTPTRQEDHPAWSPDGKYIAYSAVDGGIEEVFVKSGDNPQAEAQVLGRGRMPAWAPNGSSLMLAVDSLEGTQLIAEPSPFAGTGVSTLVIGTAQRASEPTWSGVPLPPALVNSGGLPAGVKQPLYVEQVKQDPNGLYGLGALENVQVARSTAYLSDSVNDSFNALRRKTLDAAGWDFLGQLDDAFWDLNQLPAAGEERRNWYMTGRAFGISRNLIAGFPAQLEIVREDLDVNTYWHVYVRVAEEAQSGELGEPLRRMPWDLLSRNGDVQAYDQGGRLKSAVPTGYYIDFTQLAADYGWMRVPAASDWRANVNTINYWLFEKTGGLDWYAAMRQLYTDSQLGGFAPTPTAAEATEQS